MKRTVVGCIRVGDTYRYHGLRMVKEGGSARVEDMEGDLYVVLHLAVCGMTRREMVVYQGVDGPDKGRVLVCTLWDYCVKFRPHKEPVPEPTPEPVAPVPEKPAGRISQEGNKLREAI